MSNIDSRITNGMVIPQAEGVDWLFDGHEESRFAAGIIMLGETAVAGLDGARDAYMMLRGRVYATQTRMVSQDRLVQTGPQAGAELPDEDDARSIHFGVFENAGNIKRMVACMRHIRKTGEDPRPLPIEKFFPEAFQQPATLDSFEVSRYIQRHEDRKLQNSITFPLFAKALMFALSHSDEPAYGVVEEDVERRLRDGAGVPMERVAEPMLVPEYAADNLGFVIDLREMANRYGINEAAIDASREYEREFHYFGTTAPVPEATAA